MQPTARRRPPHCCAESIASCTCMQFAAGKTEAAQRRPSPSPPSSRSSRGMTSAVSRPLQLTESLRLLGAVLSLLRLTLSLLGRRPLGRGRGDSDPSATLFRRLCSLLDFLEDVREMRSGILENGGMGGTGGRGAGVGVAAAGGGGGVFGRSFQARCSTPNRVLLFFFVGWVRSLLSLVRSSWRAVTMN